MEIKFFSSRAKNLFTELRKHKSTEAWCLLKGLCQYKDRKQFPAHRKLSITVSKANSPWRLKILLKIYCATNTVLNTIFKQNGCKLIFFILMSIQCKEIQLKVKKNKSHSKDHRNTGIMLKLGIHWLWTGLNRKERI